MKRKLIFWGGYTLVLLIPVVTWLRYINIFKLSLYDGLRLAGLLAFTLIILQIGLGAFMLFLRQYFGSWVLKLHISQGLAAFTLAWAHYLVNKFFLGFTNGPYQLWGKIGLLIMCISVAAGLLRTRPWIAKYWRLIHRLNYVLFAMIWYHSWNLGSDVRLWPMRGLYYLAPIVVVAAIVYKARQGMR
jgi:hypothetical protein